MLGLAQAGRDLFATSFASFSEQGLCRDFLGRVALAGFPSHELQADTPHLLLAVKEVQALLKSQQIDVLLVHGYKAGLVGWRAARRAGVPVIAVSRGWTSENWKVNLYERLDKLVLRWVDAVVCVSQSQADKVSRCGVRKDRIHVIPNAIDTDRFREVDPTGRIELESLFNDSLPERPLLVGAAGRLSPEKGFDILITAASQVLAAVPQARFLIFGEGALRGQLEPQIRQLRLEQRIKLVGFRQDLDRLLSHLDLFVQSSHTEGMPNVLLEALAAGVPVVATAVGGTPEIIVSDTCGDLVQAGSVSELTRALIALIADDTRRRRYSCQGRDVIAQRFGFRNQAQRYTNVLRKLVGRQRPKSQSLIETSKKVTLLDQEPPRSVTAEATTLPERSLAKGSWEDQP
jgi:glycosyltransferase involved in cell wall biosynthesis